MQTIERLARIVNLLGPRSLARGRALGLCRTSRFLYALAFALVAAAPSDASAIDPYAVYARAQQFWFDQPYAPYLTYDVAVSVQQDGRVKVERYASLFDATTRQGTIYVNGVSDYEQAHPVVPHGINVCILVCVSKPLPPIDFLGVPLLTPTYTFGMAPFIPVAPPDATESAASLVQQVRRAFHDPYPRGRRPLAPAASALPTIAHALTTAVQPYVIAYAGANTVDGHDCYHLTLQPREQPHRYRLRDLWIDTQTGATWRLRIALNFVSGPGTTSAWTVDFSNVNGIQYIAREAAEQPLHFEGQGYSEAAVSFEEIESVRALDSLDVLSFGSAAIPGYSMSEPG